MPSVTAVQPLHVALDRTADADAAGTDRQAAPGGDPPPVRLAGHRASGAGQSGRFRARHRHSARQGKTPVLDATEALQLLDRIDVSTPAGLRDRALIVADVFRGRARDLAGRAS
ncbi:hypothetical protein [Cupriavidus sp. SK-3]|uniref:hypothetical protein n=1 Tax=Cupriavidus sp. SK-3 TaxID=1470558 RepID=UPI0039C892E5